MDLHCRITYFITNKCFKELTYVEHWHGEVESDYSSFKKFKKNFEKEFGDRELVRDGYATLFIDENDEEYEDISEDDMRDLGYRLRDFYPILKCVAHGSMGEDPVETIIKTIVIPWAKE